MLSSIHYYYPNYDMPSVFWVFFLSAELEGQINAFLKRAFKYGFCTKIYTIQAIAEEADKLLFRKMISANHYLLMSHAGAVLWGGQGAHPPLRGVPPTGPQMKFLLNVFGQMEWKISDCMLVLCQKLCICTYNRSNFSSDRPLFGDPVAPNCWS